MSSSKHDRTPPADPSFEGLALLLDGYFHQDFRTEFSDHLGAARAFAREASSEELRTAARTLAEFVEWAEEQETATWQRALKRAGGAWRPRSLAPLRDVRAILSPD
ncbi:MAG: contact-dependent growth inhibition system immunity protein [Dehalococcoidia bacterium]